MKQVIKTEQAPVPISAYSQATTDGHTLFVSGALALNPVTGQLMNATIEEELHQVFKNIEAVILAAGMNMSDVYKTTVFVTDFDFYKKFDEIYKAYFPAPHPARSTVQVAGLLLGAKIEVEAIAIKAAK
jgi:2-iminobutanoate/2-iminopropanoate deaminase